MHIYFIYFILQIYLQSGSKKKKKKKKIVK